MKILNFLRTYLGNTILRTNISHICIQLKKESLDIENLILSWSDIFLLKILANL